MGKPIIATDSTKGNTEYKKTQLTEQTKQTKTQQQQQQKKNRNLSKQQQVDKSCNKARAKCSDSRRLATLSFQAISRFCTCNFAISHIGFVNIVVVVRFFLHHTSSSLGFSYFLSLSASLLAHFVVCIVKLCCCFCDFFSLALLCFSCSLVAAIFVAWFPRHLKPPVTVI